MVEKLVGEKPGDGPGVCDPEKIARMAAELRVLRVRRGDPQQITRRRLAAGARALALPSPTTRAEIAEQLNIIYDGMLALQSLDDLGNKEANDKAMRDIDTLQGQYDYLKTKLKATEK